MKKVLLLIIMMVFLVGCADRTGTTVPTETPAISPTQEITSTPTNTPTETPTLSPTSTPTPTHTPGDTDLSDIHRYVDDRHGLIRAELREELSKITTLSDYSSETTKLFYDFCWACDRTWSFAPYEPVFPDPQCEAEEKINRTLQELNDSFQNGTFMPNMSGLQVSILRDGDPVRTVKFAVAFCYENILSAVFSVEYYFPEGRTRIYNYAHPVNFNLETGEVINISALFYNDVDYIDFLRNTVLSEIDKNEYEIFIDEFGAEKIGRPNPVLENVIDVSKIDGNLPFLIDDKNIIRLFFEDKTCHDYICVRIPYVDFFERGTLHISHLDNPMLNGNEGFDIYMTEMQPGVLPEKIKPVIYKSPDKDIPVALLELSLPGYSAIHKFSGGDGIFSVNDINEMLADTDSQLYKNITGNMKGYISLSEISLGKYAVLVAYAEARTYGSTGYRVYTLFDKQTKEPLPLCLKMDETANFFKPQTDIQKWAEKNICDKLGKSGYTAITDVIKNATENICMIDIGEASGMYVGNDWVDCKCYSVQVFFKPGSVPEDNPMNWWYIYGADNEVFYYETFITDDFSSLIFE